MRCPHESEAGDQPVGFCCPICLDWYVTWEEKVACVERHGYRTLTITEPAVP